MDALGPLAVWYPMDRLDAPGLRRLAAMVEALGYDALWYPESRGYESLSLAGFLLGASTTLKIGSSIASIYARDAFAARRGLIGLSEWHGPRFILGLGVSHAPMVEKLRGQSYLAPLPAMRSYLEALYKDQDGALWPVVIAALGPKMLALAARMTRGAIPYNVTPGHTATARAALGPGKWLSVEQKVTLETDPVRARALGRAELARYLVLPNYRNAWLGMGFTEADLAEGGSDRFIDAMVLWGDAAQLRAGLAAHRAAGADQICIQPVHAEGDIAARDRILAALAP